MTTRKNTPQIGDIVQTRSDRHALASREGKLLRVVGTSRKSISPGTCGGSGCKTLRPSKRLE